MNKHTAILFLALLLCLCLTGIAAAQTCVEPTPGVIVQPGDSIAFSEYTDWASLTALWEDAPVEPTPTPKPGQDWYVINSEDLPKTGYGPHSRPLLYGLGALALAAMWMARRRRSAK